MSGKEKSYIFLNVLRFEEYIMYLKKYEYEYHENVKLLIYHPTS